MNPLFIITIYIADQKYIHSFEQQLTILLRSANDSLSIALATNSDKIYEYASTLFKSLIRIWLPANLDECNGHGIQGKRFRFAFSKISTLRLIAQSKTNIELELQQYSHLVLIDSDSFFPSRVHSALKDRCFYGVNYREEHHTSLSALIPLFHTTIKTNENFLSRFWINTGYLAIPTASIDSLSRYCQYYLDKLKVRSTEIFATVNHYSDENVFNFAIAALLSNETYTHNFTPVSSPKKQRPAFLWTIPMQSRKITLISYLNTPCHVHIPDIKYSMEKMNIYVYLSKLSVLSKSLARFSIISVFNSQVLWHKLIRPFLSGLKRIQFKRIF